MRIYHAMLVSILSAGRSRTIPGVMAPALHLRVLEPDGNDSAQQPPQQSGDATSSSENQHSNQ